VDIEGLYLLGDPVAMVVAMGSNSFNIYRLSDAMSQRGYAISQCQLPACIHICVTLRHVPHTEAIIQALRECTAEILASPAKPGEEGRGAAIYGVVQSMPEGSLDSMLSKYLDGVYELEQPKPSSRL